MNRVSTTMKLYHIDLLFLQNLDLDDKIESMNLKEIQAPVEDLLEKTDKIIRKKISSNVALIKQITQLTPVYKGKKIRSTFLFLLAKLNRIGKEYLPKIAASIEMLHLSSLIHDDIVDNSGLRRGQKTLNANLGNVVSVLGGDFLFINSLSSLNKIEKKYLLDIILNSACNMIEGQIMEVENNFNYRLKCETYYKIIRNKTSSLFAGIAELIPALASESDQQRQHFYQFGLDFGTIFQISDDMLDIFSVHSGKDRFRDLKEGKITLPYILLLREGNGNLLPYLKNGNPKRLLTLFEKHDIKKLCFQQMDQYHKNCLRFLSVYPESEPKVCLLKLLRFTHSRDY